MNFANFANFAKLGVKSFAFREIRKTQKISNTSYQFLFCFSKYSYSYELYILKNENRTYLLRTLSTTIPIFPSLSSREILSSQQMILSFQFTYRLKMSHFKSSFARGLLPQSLYGCCGGRQKGSEKTT